MERNQRYTSLYSHPLPFVRGELEREFNTEEGRKDMYI